MVVFSVSCHWVCIYMNIYTEHSIYGFCLSFVIYDEKFGQISISQQLRSSHYPSSHWPSGLHLHLALHGPQLELPPHPQCINVVRESDAMLCRSDPHSTGGSSQQQEIFNGIVDWVTTCNTSHQVPLIATSNTSLHSTGSGPTKCYFRFIGNGLYLMMKSGHPGLA